MRHDVSVTRAMISTSSVTRPARWPRASALGAARGGGRRRAAIAPRRRREERRTRGAGAADAAAKPTPARASTSPTRPAATSSSSIRWRAKWSGGSRSASGRAASGCRKDGKQLYDRAVGIADRRARRRRVEAAAGRSRRRRHRRRRSRQRQAGPQVHERPGSRVVRHLARRQDPLRLERGGGRDVGARPGERHGHRARQGRRGARRRHRAARRHESSTSRCEGDNEVVADRHRDPARSSAGSRRRPRPRSIVFTPDGATAFVASENGGAVSVVDAQKHTRARDDQDSADRGHADAAAADGHGALARRQQRLRLARAREVGRRDRRRDAAS